MSEKKYVLNKDYQTICHNYKAGTDVAFFNGRYWVGFETFTKKQMIEMEDWFRPVPEASKPPLGIMPEWRHKELRLQEIKEAITRYNEPGREKEVPMEWVTESVLIQEWLKRWNEKNVTSPSKPENEKRDWEIVEFKSYLGKYISYQGGDVSSFESLNIAMGSIINSVKRLSDNSVWSVGDMLYNKTKIVDFHIRNERMYAGVEILDTNTFGTIKDRECHISNLSKPSTPSQDEKTEPLFVWTEDLIVEFASWSCANSPTFQGRYTDLEQFKKSKQQ